MCQICFWRRPSLPSYRPKFEILARACIFLCSWCSGVLQPSLQRENVQKSTEHYRCFRVFCDVLETVDAHGMGTQSQGTHESELGHIP